MPKKKIKKAKTKHKPSTKRTLEEVLSSLQDLTKNELSDVDLHSRAGTEPDKKQTEEPQQEKTGEDPDSPEAEKDDSIELDIPPPQSELVSGETGDIFDGLELLPDEQIANEDETDQSNQAENSDHEHDDIRWEDIPVLEDVAEDPLDTTPLDLHEFQSPDRKQARNIAIQVAARLNIEMRKRGQTGLDISTINRLRDLLVKELAKAATKSENGDN